MLYCPIYTLTWYPGSYPSDASPLLLQSADHHSSGFAALAAMVEDSVQEAEFVRGASPDFYNRGNRRSRFDWEEIRRYATPSGALAAGLAAVEAMPSVTGWLRIDIPAEGRAWVASPCMIRSAGVPAVEKAGAESLLRLRWVLLCGPLTEIATTAEEGAITSEIGTEILTEDGFYLALETLV